MIAFEQVVCRAVHLERVLHGLAIRSVWLARHAVLRR
jgi:hypothetical protein